jgi:DNA-binding transcriptional ArsR family regulator
METNKRLDLIFFSLSHSRRREILEHLSEDKKTVGELADNFEVSLSTISKHLKLLEEAELIFKSKRGRTVYCHLNFDVWKEVAAYISMYSKFWNSRLDELESFINTKT